MKKKVVSLASVGCALSLCLVLGACGTGSTSSGDNSSTNTSSKTYDMELSESDRENTCFFDTAKIIDDMNMVIADDEICTITVIGSLEEPVYDRFGYRLFVTNNSDKHLYGTPRRDFKVNGTEQDPIGGFFLGAGKSAETDIYFREETVKSADELKDIQGIIQVRDEDADAYVVLGEYEFVI